MDGHSFDLSLVETYGASVRRRRRASAATQSDLATAAGVRTETICRIEKNLQHGSVSTRQKIEDALVTLAALHHADCENVVMTATDVTFGWTVRRRRDDLNLTQEELGEMSGVHRRTIMEIEADRRAPWPTTRASIITALTRAEEERRAQQTMIDRQISTDWRRDLVVLARSTQHAIAAGDLDRARALLRQIIDEAQD